MPTSPNRFRPARQPAPPQVAILCPSRSPGWFASRVAAAAIQELSRHGCRVRVISAADNRRKGKHFLDWLRAQGINAAVDTACEWWLGQPRQTIETADFPLVTANHPHPQLRAHRVGVDARAMARLQLDHLQAVGYRRCGYLLSTARPHALDRLRAFREEAEKRRLWEPRCLLDISARLRTHPWATIEPAQLAVAGRALRSVKEPVAICSHNDYAAAAFLDWLLLNRFEVPAQIGVIGCDDDPLYSLASIGLTTVHLPVEEMGIACAAIVLEALRSPRPLSPTDRMLQPALVVRGSTVAAGGPGRWLTVVIETIQANPTMKHLGAALSAHTGWTYDTVERRFKRAMGMTLLEYRDQVRLDRAAELLRQEPRAKIEYICRQVGFSSPGRFAAAFRARHGVSPRQFSLSASR